MGSKNDGRQMHRIGNGFSGYGRFALEDRHRLQAARMLPRVYACKPNFKGIAIKEAQRDNSARSGNPA